MTLNQLRMANLAPRGIKATCVPTSICFLTGVCYQDVESLLVREQGSTYRPDIKGNKGVDTVKLLGTGRVIFGHRFIRIGPVLGKLERVHQFKLYNYSGAYLVCVPHHAFVIKDAEAFDLIDTNWNNWVHAAWRVEKV